MPIGANSPQKAPYGLYNEKLSGTAFTAPRHENLQTWLYRILPAAAHAPFEPKEADTYKTSPGDVKLHQIPNQLRWDPFDLDDKVLLKTLHRRNEFKDGDSSRVAKFMPQYDGPYEIVDCHPKTSNYTLALPNQLNVFPTFHSSELRRFVPNNDTQFPICAQDSHTMVERRELP